MDEEDKQRECNRAHQSDPDSRQQLSASVDAAVVERKWHGAVRASFVGGILCKPGLYFNTRIGRTSIEASVGQIQRDERRLP